MANPKNGKIKSQFEDTDGDMPEVPRELMNIREALGNLQDKLDQHQARIKSLCIQTPNEVGLDETENESEIGRELQLFRISINNMGAQLKYLTNSLAI